MSRGTTQRNVRIEDAVWERVVTRAGAEGTTVSAVVRDFLERWGTAAPEDAAAEK